MTEAEHFANYKGDDIWFKCWWSKGKGGWVKENIFVAIILSFPHLKKFYDPRIYFQFKNDLHYVRSFWNK